MRLRSTRVVAAVSAVLCAALLAACGAVGANNTRGAADTATSVRVLDPYGGDLAAEGTPKSGGNLIIGNDREIVSFDPTVQNANQAAFAVDGVLDRHRRQRPDLASWSP